MSARFAKTCMLLMSALLLSCADAETEPATQIIVAITSDIEVETSLARIAVKLSNRNGDNVVAMQDYALVRENPEAGQYQLPLTFSVAKGAENSVLIEVTGYGPLGAGGAERKIVEQRAIATFQADRTLLLRIFLGQVCQDNFCGGDATLVCYAADRFEIEAGDCGAIMELDQTQLEQVDTARLPDLSEPPPDVVIADGGIDDPGTDAGQDAGQDAGADAGGCEGDECPCIDAQDCDDGMFCTVDVCDEDGACQYSPRECEPDDNACTLAPVCDEDEDSCVEAFDETSLTSIEHCGASASSTCEVCEASGTLSSTCDGGRCALACAQDYFDADGEASNGCECLRMSEDDLSDDFATDENCDGADGEVAGDYTLYVTSDGAGDRDGSSPANAANLVEAFAIATAAGAARELLVASGVYVLARELNAPDELVLFGGYAADFRSRSGTSTVATPGATALRIIGASTIVKIDSIDFKTEAQTAFGAPTQTIVIDSSQVTFRRLSITAGDGGPGQPGGTGTGTVGATIVGAPGYAGSTTTGGAGGNAGPGGNGGAGGNYSGGVPGTGGGGSAGNTTGLGCGGPGAGGPGQSFACALGFAYQGDPGSSGQPGCAGGIGSHGSGGAGTGSIANLVWSGPVAQAGGTGRPGGSGGGGGGGGAAECSVGAAGGGGGEGGVGGEGGGGGSPGGAGGASIAIVVQSSLLGFEQVELRTGSGGSGGQGGDGGPGGAGAAGGLGGGGGSNSSGTFPNNTGVIGGTGGRGGIGGTGGLGGCGGGGAGGPSVGIFASEVGTEVMLNGAPTFRLGAGGAAGLACPTNAGNAGTAANAYNQLGF